MHKFITIFVTIFLLKSVCVFAKEPEIKTNMEGVSYYQNARFKKNEITKSFYYLRHGQTDVNKYGVIPEDSDVPLNEEGILQVNKAAKLLRDKNIKIIVSSPLLRTKQTADIIKSELNIPIIYYEGLKEANRGFLKGENIKQNKKKEIWSKGGKVPGAESLYNFEMRVHDTIKEIVNKYDNVLIVGHGVYFGNLTLLLNEEYIIGRNALPYYFKPNSEKKSKELYQISNVLTGILP